MRIKTLLITLAVVLDTLSLSAKNVALIVGIGNYNTKATGWSVIHGNNDAILLGNRLKRHGFSVTSLTDKQATKANVEKALKTLYSSVHAGDVVYLHFSGHGQLIEDMNNDEQEGFDQSFICYDACFSPKYKVSGTSYRGQNHLVDDELFPYLNTIKQKVGKSGRVMVIFDTCYSGGADRGEMSDDPDPESEVEWVETTRGTEDEFQINRSAKTFLRNLKKPGNYTTKGGAITIISACESDKKNYECKEKHSGRRYGSLSYCIGKMLDKNIPMSQWDSYFRTEKYKSLKIFRPSQSPVIEVH